VYSIEVPFNETSIMPQAKKQPRTPGRPRDPAADEAIIQTAIELFLDQGVEAVCIDQIAKRTGISRATIYRRWSDREDLLADALLRFRDQTKANLNLSHDAKPRAVAEYIAAQLIEALMQPEAQRFTAHAIGAMPGHPKVSAVYKKQFIEPWRSSIKNALRAARNSRALPQTATEEVLLDLMSGAVMQRILMRTQPPSLKQERAWVKSLLHHLGL
jgi:AcrR family transcriptional regulator